MALLNPGATIMLNALAGAAAVAATRYVGLFVGQPSAGGVEPSAAGYARLARTAAQQVVANNVISISAGEWDDSADASWGTPDWIGVYTAAVGGDLIWESEISPDLAEITASTRVFTEMGDIDFTIPLA